MNSAHRILLSLILPTIERLSELNNSKSARQQNYRSPSTIFGGVGVVMASSYGVGQFGLIAVNMPPSVVFSYMTALSIYVLFKRPQNTLY